MSCTTVLRFLSGIACLGSALAGSAELVPIDNAGFESPVLEEGQDAWSNVPGWTYLAGADLWITHPPSDLTPFVPDGHNVLFINNWEVSVSQQTVGTVVAGGRYRLSAHASRFEDVFRGGWIELWAGGTLNSNGDFVGGTLLGACHVSSSPGAGETFLPFNDWGEAAAMYESPWFEPLEGQPLGIRLVTDAGSSGPVSWDRVVLERVPPAFFNGSFEYPRVETDQMAWSIAPGWTFRENADLGVYHPSTSAYPTVPDGLNVLSLNNWETPISQQSWVEVVPGHAYRLSGWASRRSSEWKAGRIELWAGGTLDANGDFADGVLLGTRAVSTTPGPNDVSLVPGIWNESTIEYTSPWDDSLWGQKLGVRVVTDGGSVGPIEWDHVQLETTRPAIENGSFEFPFYEDGLDGSSIAPYWTFRKDADVGTFNPTYGDYTTLPQGNQALYINNWETPVAQQTAVRFEAGKTVQLSAFAGNRNGEWKAGRLEMWVGGVLDEEGEFRGGTLIASQRVNASPSPGEALLPTRDWAQVTVSGTVPAGNPSVGQKVGFRVLTEGGSVGPIDWDFFQLATPSLIHGMIVLEDFAGIVAGRTVAIEVLALDGSVLESGTATLGPNYEYTFETHQRGEVMVAAKGSHWLRQVKGPFTATESGIDWAYFRLANGDVDGDNVVTVFDYNLMSDAFDTTDGDPGWNPEADLDGDRSVTVFDYNILSNNFDRAGD